MGRASAHSPSERTAASEANSASLFGGLDPNLVEISNTAGECGIAQCCRGSPFLESRAPGLALAENRTVGLLLSVPRKSRELTLDKIEIAPVCRGNRHGAH